MRILHVGKYYPPFLGGMETVLENLAVGLLDAGQEVSVLVAAQSGKDSRETIDGDGSNGRLTRLARFGVVNSQPLTLGLTRALRREIQDFQPDLVHLHLPNPLLGLAWLTLAAGSRGSDLPPCLVWHHADITRQKMGRALTGPVVRRCLEEAAGICVSSGKLLENSRDLAPYRDKVAVIPFGIDSHPWSEVRSTCAGPFLFIGRLVHYKGLEILIEAIGASDGGELVMVGEGPLQAKLERLVSSLGLGTRVRLAGSLPTKDILSIMGTARALVLPSIDASETFGLVQLEAMAAGLAVVATDLPTGVAEVGQAGQTCLLVSPGDTESLRSALNLLLADKETCRTMGQRGREHFLANYSRPQMISAVLTWYETVLSRTDRTRKE